MTNLPMPGSRVRAIGTDSERQVGVVCEEAGETDAENEIRELKEPQE